MLNILQGSSYIIYNKYIYIYIYICHDVAVLSIKGNSPTTASSSGEETKKKRKKCVRAFQISYNHTFFPPLETLIILNNTLLTVSLHFSCPSVCDGTKHGAQLTLHHSKVQGDGYDVLQGHVLSSDRHPSMGINKDSTKDSSWI